MNFYTYNYFKEIIMKLKLGIIYGVLIWVVTYIISTIAQPLLYDNNAYTNLIMPAIIVIVTGFFGILYIRNFNKNEVIEGFLGGIVFIIIDIILDVIFFTVLNFRNDFMSDYPIHIILMSVILLMIPTFLGYLAQMKIELK